MINNSSSRSTSTSTSIPALSKPSEQEDFEVLIFPPPIDWDDDGWDDDVLPPPPTVVSDDQMSVVSDEDLPAESNSQLTETLDEDLLVPPPTSLVSEVVEEVALCSESATTATASEMLFGSSKPNSSPTEILLDDNSLDPPPTGAATTTTEVFRGPSQHSKARPIQMFDDEVVVASLPSSSASIIVPEIQEAAPRDNSDATLPDGLPVPSEARYSKHSNTLDYTSTQQQTLQDFFNPKLPFSPLPSAPLEPTHDISCDNKQMSVNMCEQPIMKVSHLIRQRRRNTDKKYESRISDRIERKDVHNNKSKECLSLILATSSDDSMALQMNQLQQEHHRRISSSNSSVHNRSEFIHNHLCSSKQEKSQLFEERKSQKMARSKRRIGRFFNEIMSNILDETHCVVQCH